MCFGRGIPSSAIIDLGRAIMSLYTDFDGYPNELQVCLYLVVASHLGLRCDIHQGPPQGN